jgi:hypothetical protein
VIEARRVTTVVAVLAVVAVALVLRDPAGSEGEPAGDDLASPSPSAPPSEVPTDEFCAAFAAMAAAHNNHLANDTPESLAEVTTAGQTVLDLAPGTTMPPLARSGLEYFVLGVMERQAEPVSEEESAAFTSFLELACRPGT